MGCTGAKLVMPKTRVPYQVVGSVWDPYTGERCEGNASCVPICPVQAKYNALKTLKNVCKKTSVFAPRLWPRS